MFSVSVQPSVRQVHRLRVIPLRWNESYWCPLIRVASSSARAKGEQCRPRKLQIRKRLSRSICASAARNIRQTFCLLPRKRIHARPVRADRSQALGFITPSRRYLRLTSLRLYRTEGFAS